jgi:hypothetical protein
MLYLFGSFLKTAGSEPQSSYLLCRFDVPIEKVPILKSRFKNSPQWKILFLKKQANS